MIWRTGARSLDLSARCRIMGILNATPDSFFDGGRYLEKEAAIERGLQMVEEGAEIVDVGGESSRPPMYGEAMDVSAEEECRRVLPVIEGIRERSDVIISVDTVKGEVARRAVASGADIVNDISAMTADPQMLEVVAGCDAGAVLMHRRGTPATMQQDTEYADLLGEIREHLHARIAAAAEKGISAERIAVDPGLGFGKSVDGNLQLIRHLDVFADLGCPLLLGASRKSFIWRTLELAKEESLEGGLAVAVIGVLKGARILRVHDVKETVRVVRMAEAVIGSGKAAGTPPSAGDVDSGAGR